MQVDLLCLPIAGFLCSVDRFDSFEDPFSYEACTPRHSLPLLFSKSSLFLFGSSF